VLSAAHVRWGIAGPGEIAERFVAAMGAAPAGRVVAVASRSRERARAFAERHAIGRAHGSYAELAGDDQVEVVYVAVPHSHHEAVTLLCLAAGKHVLCEKPLALNARQAERMASAARQHRRFLMEAIWSRFLPAYRTLGELLAAGQIGRPLLVEAEFGFRMPVMPAHRLFDPELGGGAALDLGIYPLQLASLVLGPPDRVVAVGAVGDTGVDELVAALTAHPGGGVGVAKAALRANLAGVGRVVGESGTIELAAPMHDPRSVTLTSESRSDVVPCAYDGDGLRFEIDEVHRCLAAGELESPVLSLDESLALARALDAIRADLGVVYPGDSA
jgi:predicted dehydrogenase